MGTHFGNAGHVFVPLGEQFFVDAVKRFRPGIDEEARATVNAFVGQEVVHARAHQAAWDALRDHGVPVDAYVELIRRARGLEEHLPPALLLATTAALEHFTAVFGHHFLTEDLAVVVPDEMAELLAWHGYEELEHRAVAFDVLAGVDDSLVLRAAGMAMAVALLSLVPAVGVSLFAAAEVRRRPLQPWRWPNPRLLAMSARLLADLGLQIAAYLRPGFHPSDGPPAPVADRWS